jgi:CRISPR-associated protein Csx14
MADADIPVDLFNPGQVFACLGFLEAADVFLGDAQGGFDWRDEADVRFRIRAAGTESPVEAVMKFLVCASIKSIAPAGSGNTTAGWQVPTAILEAEATFPYPDPKSSATLPAVLEGRVSDAQAPVTLCIDHWGDETRRDPVKFWGGGAGYPGVALARDALDLVRLALAPGAPSDQWTAAVADPFSLSAEQSSSFRFDWRRDYVPIDIGFSINTQKGRIATVGFPIVELLAAIGLGHARPARLSKLEYSYGTVGARDGLLDPILLRAGLGGPELPLPRRSFRMQLAYPGKEGQARVITTVTEEAIP